MAGSPSITNSQRHPAMPPKPMQAEQRAGHRTADDGGDRHRRHEQRDDAGALFAREPVGEVEDDAGKEARLGDAEQKALSA